MRSDLHDLTGRRFGNYEVLRVGTLKNGHTHWVCRCSCGQERQVSRVGLMRGTSKSCGCLMKDVARNSIRDRMSRLCIPEPNSGCWLWIGALSGRDGYGQVSFESKMHKAHRLMYALEVGPIPERIEVCHRCDVPCCVNPDHLFLGTHLENMIDRDRKGRRKAPRGDENSNSKLTERDVRKIKGMIGSIPVKQIARQFGVDYSTIHLIKTGRNWSHVS